MRDAGLSDDFVSNRKNTIVENISTVIRKLHLFTIMSKLHTKLFEGKITASNVNNLSFTKCTTKSGST